MEKCTLRKDGLYRIQIYLGKVDGQSKFRYVYGKTQEEAEEKANDVRAKMKKGLDVIADRDSFRVWAERWLRIKKADIGAGQYKSYQGYLKRLAPLNRLPISNIKTYDIQVIIADPAEKNPTTGKPTSKKTLQDIKNTACQVIQLAVDNRVIDYNPAQAVRVPKNAPKKSRRALTEEEQSWIVNIPHRMQTAAMIMLYSGLRRGELIPLLWSDIDLEGRTICVNKSVDVTAGKAVIKQGAKTAAGSRTVDIPLRLVEYLRANKPSSEGLVCPSLSGGLYSADSWQSSWYSYMLDIDVALRQNKISVVQKDGTEKEITRESKFDKRFKGLAIPNITPHMLRHTFCTLLYFAGVDVLTAQQQMGHADAKTTLGIYTHLDAAHKRRQMTKLDDYLSGGQ